MIDLHNHILPDTDDGSISLEMSLSMLHTAAEQGITDVVNTVHFQHPKFSEPQITHAELQKRLGDLQAAIDQEGIPIKLHLGAEVFYMPNLLELKDNPLCTFGHGKYMLIEFLFPQMPPRFEQLLFDLKMAGCTPIIAHPERYRAVQNDVHLLANLIESGCLVQLDAGSLTGSLGKSAYQSSREILANGYCQLLGSDAHDARSRNFLLGSGLELAQEIAGEQALDWVSTNPQKILNGDTIRVDMIPRYDQRPSLFERIKSRLL
ncbi:hypothetical protein HQ531_00705 [bacterium]|nr:hypothetical protein [bacterium]